MTRVFQIVEFNPISDGVTALYEEGKLVSWGDEYHDKVDVYINGFLEGVKYAGDEVETENYYGVTEEIYEEWDPEESLDSYELGVELVDFDEYQRLDADGRI